MGTRTRPDSSFSRHYLTTSNFSGKHLLSTFNNGTNEPNNPPKPERPEPGIDDAPISSSDDEVEAGDRDIVDISDLEEDKELKAPEKQSLEDKLAESSAPARRSGRAPVSKQDGDDKLEVSSSQEKTRARTSSALDDRDNLIEMWGSSQHSKRRKGAQFSSQSRPSVSSVPSSQDSKSTSKPQKNKKAYGKKSPQEKKKKKEESSFQMPREIDMPSPPPSKTRANGKSPEFKNPPALPNGISSDNDPQFADVLDLPSQDDASPLSSPINTPSPPSSAFNFEFSQADEEITLPKKALCPMCKEEVDPEALMRFEAQPKQRFRDQMVFCESHQASSAEKEWKSKGYPTIDWDIFDERIRGYYDDLAKFLVPECSSYYRNLLDSAMKSGKAKNFRLTLSGGGLEDISCGYYGTRGSGKMLQAVTTHFAPQLRRLAAADNIVKTAGVAGYAQAVLVPELAVRLVKEDMNIDDDQSARQILRDSISIGEKLNAQLNDVVPVPELDEDKENVAA
ncbi:RTC4 family protein [Aspergillus glaucus CBS 516.65]|uniref:Restriction of telomere capping protein 4 n=1 Tax=Aspergillus glaucus CBS 516.65 TaxID=1160497 RepID=A0A1L9VRA8_ASPGL|nr:hypothetical protein ASPGLDRAFT_121225 [Aspergillus glaucus CBS 516.65]OJJ86436.1 hypothetical protein ASPGLDRAFT_121225 [Aspergillus glaucus CBS 516.65]